ncbi:MazG nucleotide pyrophosphohydrolase domain-containing protein [Streptococcus respiraculi]|uniref:MazG nucleotide pyrophosphohydrolase domain-containing protein n=1 Tax=Streptococcus respiraculi TaxID=2021971 RepID=UPI000E760A27|nr:MazG nucleotide pyrophosphohydrolase domain-containing protein [Streptococcus respiraculi]
MDIRNYQDWVSRFYKERGWYAYNPFIRTNFLCEEVGELAQAIRKMEIGRDRPDEPISNQKENLLHIREELGDVLDNLFIIADIYQISLEDIMTSHKKKLEERFKGQ